MPLMKLFAAILAILIAYELLAFAWLQISDVFFRPQNRKMNFFDKILK